VAIPCRRLGTI